MVLADIPVGSLIGRDRAADRRSQQALRFVAAAAAHDAKGDRPGNELLEPLGFRYHPALGGKDARYLDQVAPFDPCIAQRPLEGMKFVLVSADTLGKKYFPGNKTFHPSSPLPLGRLPFFAVSPLYGKIGVPPMFFYRVPCVLPLSAMAPAGKRVCGVSSFPIRRPSG